MIPVIDIFAGPGGLGEGFSSARNGGGREQFRLGLSIEMDPYAHETLRLRSFKRMFGDNPPDAYLRLLRREASWSDLQSLHRSEAAVAEREARRITLGPDSVIEVRDLIRAAISRQDRWVLVGGPPCQAYSLVGRARNRGVAGYRPELDHRQTLYVEYLQILSDHAPPVFIMENVKGLLSAQMQSHRMFERIQEDLSDPGGALKREGRYWGRRRPSYSIHSVVCAEDGQPAAPADYVVRAERYGIPQRRHRVILVGIRSDVSASLQPLLPAINATTVNGALSGLPRLRSGLSKETDSDDAWIDSVREIGRRPWLRGVAPNLRSRIRHFAEFAASPSASRGGDYLASRGRITLNHSTRSHIRADLERYFFASVFAKEYGRSPILAEFPPGLLPMHRNVDRALGDNLFSDRFRVQIGLQPSTTITSHISKDGHYYIHPDPTQCRSLTVREAARLQTFPDDYFFCGPRTSQYHQVGNAVPPALARLIANVVAPILGG